MRTQTLAAAPAAYTPPAAATLAPADPSQRVELVDALRGFALFGVCLSNLFASFAHWNEPATRALATWVLPSDRVATIAIEALVEGKFYSIFSLLFGLGFALQIERGEARGTDPLPLFRRRLRVLMAIGFAHLAILWSGDILLFYALMGLVLVRLRTWSDDELLRVAALFVAVPIVQYLPTMIHFLVSPAFPFFGMAFALTKVFGVDINHMGDEMYRMYASGDVRRWFELTAMGIPGRYADLLHSGRPWKVLAMFLLGLWIGRRRLWATLDAHVPMLRRVAGGGFALGLPASVAWAMFHDSDSWFRGTLHGLGETALYSLSVAPLALAYAASFALLWRGWGGRMLRVFAPAGRMALTNYLTQTVLALALYSGFGLGLAGKVGPTWMWLEAIATLALQIVVSRWWLARYRFGPMEWVWRSLTYRARQPMRRQPVVM